MDLSAIQGYTCRVPPVDDGERASLGSIARNDLRQARGKTAIGNLARVFESKHVN